MAVKINFDNTHNIIQPTLVIVSKSGKMIGKIPYHNLIFKDSMNQYSDLFFKVNKSECMNNGYWDNITDFKLLWIREWNKLFEISVELDTSSILETIKNITAKSLGETELSQINLYNIEINTENDILRDDYKPTVLFDENDPKASLLSRIMEKAPHYLINHVDSSISHIQRTFTFDDITIYDAFQKISEEINCLFIIDCYLDSNSNIIREINVYDLESYCVECGERGNFISFCDKCGSSNILHGYGDDTTIFITTENLADNIRFSTDNGSVKNCFKLKAGDDLMTATVMNCNPNGSGYLWYISDAMKNDMSEELVDKLNLYDEQYDYYQKEYNIEIPNDLITKYNNLIRKYSSFSNKFNEIISEIKGYPSLMKNYYDVIDFYLYLNNILMPNVEIQNTTAALEVAKLNFNSLSPVAVTDLNVCSVATVENAVLSIAKIIIDSRYKVKILDSQFSDNIWSGTFVVTNYSDSEDTATSSIISCEINDNYEDFIKQKINKALNKDSSKDEATDIIKLFSLSLEDFSNELKKYSLSRLKAFNDNCQTCINILIEQGVSDNETWADKNPNLYNELYLPYYNKLNAISEETKIREDEIAIIIGAYDKEGELSTEGLQIFLDNEKNKIQNILNFEEYLGNKLWTEFISYCREDTYSNDNYISDGLNNSELFQRALEFINTAQKDIFKSATLQHSISATLKNLLIIKEFEPIIDNFKIGNWLRVGIEGNIYKLRLIDYEIDFDNIENISITFSDVTIVPNGINDVESILNQASSIASSYDYVAKQAKKGNQGNEQLNDWVNNGLSLTKVKIIDNADNQNMTWDNHGFLCREYLPIDDSYDDKQLKLINRGLFLTDDSWLTTKTGVGDFTYWNPETQKIEEGYGVIADKLVGNLILSKKVGIYNTNNSIVMDENGFIITSQNNNDNSNQRLFTIQKKELKSNNEESITPIMYIDSNGDLVLNGSIKINTISDTNINTIDDIADVSRFSGLVNDIVHTEAQNIYTTIDDRYTSVLQETTNQLNQYKAEIGQYMQFNNEGLTLGAINSVFKTVIDNKRLAFYDGNTIAAYINNSQLFIPNAVIENTLSLGKFFLSSRSDGGFSITWQG